MDVVRWLATGIAHFSIPDPASAPADVARVLSNAFEEPSWTGEGLVTELVQDIAQLTHGDVTLSRADSALFGTKVRGPAAYLSVTGTRRLLLVPDPAHPVRYDR